MNSRHPDRMIISPYGNVYLHKPAGARSRAPAAFVTPATSLHRRLPRHKAVQHSQGLAFPVLGNCRPRDMAYRRSPVHEQAAARKARLRSRKARPRSRKLAPGAVRPVSHVRAQRLGTHLVRPHGIRRAARGLAAGGCAGVGSLAGTGTWHARAERCASGKVACKNRVTRIALRRRSSAIGRRPHISDLGTTEAARRRSVRLKPSSSDMNAASLQKTPARVVPRWLKCLLRPARHSTAPASKAALRPQQDERGINDA